MLPRALCGQERCLPASQSCLASQCAPSLVAATQAAPWQATLSNAPVRLHPPVGVQSSSVADDMAAAAAAEAPRPPPPLPQPAGSLSLTVDRITLSTASTADCFFVLKCGPHWGRSQPLPMSGEWVAGLLHRLSDTVKLDMWVGEWVSSSASEMSAGRSAACRITSHRAA